jgi:glutathione S-transferase
MRPSSNSSSSRLRLITIGVSHFCEKARWALDYAGCDYVEEPHVPLFHRFWTVPNGGRSVPLLVTGDGPIQESSAIVRFADRSIAQGARLFPEDRALSADVEALVDRFDRELGPAARRLAYFHLLRTSHPLRCIVASQCTPWEATALRIVEPALIRVMRKGLGIHERGAQKSERRLNAVFSVVDERLTEDAGYLVGARFTAADLTLAALLAPIVLPAEYGAPLPGLDDIPAEFAALMARCRESKTGQHALRMYREHRRGRAPN